MDKYHKDLAKLAISALSKAEEVNASTRWNGEVAVNFTLPKGAIKVPEAPTKDYTEMHQWQYKETCEEIENAIRILKMTDEEVVNTSTYNAIARYL
jgi:hypothetical protein